jgi:hypothetical protein
MLNSNSGIWLKVGSGVTKEYQKAASNYINSYSQIIHNATNLFPWQDTTIPF